MNELIERYVGAVCSYFIGIKRQYVYDDLKKQILDSSHHYDDLEELLISYGHPRSMALSYGYRPKSSHKYNPKVVSLCEKVLFISSGIYLFFSTLYYLQQLNCLPFQSSSHVVATFNTSTLITWILSHPFIIIGGFIVITIILLNILDYKHPLKEEHYLQWTKKELYKLPHQSHYPNHTIETIFMFAFILYFIIYTFYFHSEQILIIQHESYQMIHLMTYFFQPFILIIIVDYFIDMTKKIYTKKYLKYSSLINAFTFLALTIFIINSHFLENYLLPFNQFSFILVNILIIGALLMILTISVYKLIRNIKSYRYLIKN